jgi:hypothetical protein
LATFWLTRSLSLVNPFRIFRILMNVENGGGAGAGGTAAGAAATSSGAAAGSGAAASSAAGTTAAAGGANPSGAAAAPAPDVAALLQRMDALAATVEKLSKAPAGAAAAGAPPDAAAIAAQVTAQVTFNTAINAAGLSPEQQAAVRTLFDAEKPAVDKLGEWLKTRLALFGKAPVAPPPAQSSARTDLGAPAGAGGNAGTLPDDPRAIPLDQWKNMDPKERQAITRRWASRNGGNTGILRRNAS